MPVTKGTSNGQPVLTAQLPNGGTKVVFPDGKIVFLAPSSPKTVRVMPHK